MSEKKYYTVLLVYSSSYAIRAEQILSKANICSKMIPIPRHISSDCGVCVRIGTEDKEKALSLLHSYNLPLDGAYEI